MQSHFLPRDLRVGRKTRAYWAVEPRGDLIVFVHGFRGAAVSTWIEFPTLMLARPEIRHVDVLFYGYDGGRTRVAPSAATFLQLLERLATNPASLISSRAECRPRQFRFRRILVVAHSLGAVVSRQTLVFAQQEKRRWTKIVRLILFAPAHKGSDIVRMCSSIFGMFKPLSGEGIEAILKMGYPVLRDLESGSPTLAQLERRTLALTTPNTRDHPLIARRVFIGAKDRVVDPNQFANDPPPISFDGINHRRICKPSATFSEPLDALLEAL